jgi:uncharacterized membrane protein YfcA
MPADLFVWSAYLMLGVIAGLVGGLLGLGGGILIVPALLFLFIWQGMPADILMHLAVATSLFTIVFTSISSSYAHHKHQAVLWSQVFLLTPGIIIGAVFGAFLADYISSDILRRLFGIFEILVACQIGFSVKPSAQRSLPGRNGMLIAGGGIGTLSTILGIGGGTLTVPFFVWCHVDIRKAIATSSACGFPIALAGTLAMIYTGLDSTSLPENTIGYVHWPAAILILATSVLFAPVGAKLAHSMPVDLLKRVFAIVLACVGLRMLF